MQTHRSQHKHIHTYRSQYKHSPLFLFSSPPPPLSLSLYPSLPRPPSCVPGWRCHTAAWWCQSRAGRRRNSHDCRPRTAGGGHTPCCTTRAVRRNCTWTSLEVTSWGPDMTRWKAPPHLAFNGLLAILPTRALHVTHKERVRRVTIRAFDIRNRRWFPVGNADVHARGGPGRILVNVFTWLQITQEVQNTASVVTIVPHLKNVQWVAGVNFAAEISKCIHLCVVGHSFVCPHDAFSVAVHKSIVGQSAR